MADASQLTDDSNVGTNATSSSTNTHSARTVLLKRNPHLRDNNPTSSPAGFGALGTRQFLQKQLMTPGSATSASSFEEGASTYDGFSDAGTPASDETLATKSGDMTHTSLRIDTESAETAHYVTRTASKQPTKRLSSPSRASLARRLSANVHGMLLDGESVSEVDRMEGALPPSEMITNIVVKKVPSISIEGEPSTMVPLSPRSTKVTRRIVASPRKTMRRVVLRKTGADGQVHEVVQYLDADGQVVTKEGNFFNAEGGEAEVESTSSSSTTVTRRISTPSKTLRRVVVRRTGADGQVHQEVQFLDADGTVVRTEGVETFSSSSSTSTPSQSTITRRIVTPGTLTRRILRHTGTDGQVHEEVQYLDVDGNVVRSEGDEAPMSDSASTTSSGTVITRRIVTPGKTIRRVSIRRTGAGGQVHEEVQFMDADGNVVQSDDSDLISASELSSASGSDAPGFSSGRTTVTRQTLKRVLVRRKGADGQVRDEVQYVDAEGNVVPTEGGNLSATEGSSDASGQRNVTRRVIRRTMVQKEGTSVPVEQYVDWDGQIIEGEGRTLVRAGSFAGSVSSVTSDTSTGTSSRRFITRRVVASPVRRTSVHKTGSISGAESEDDVQYLELDAEDRIRSGSSTRGTVTRRVVTPQRVIRRMARRTGGTESGTEADVDELDGDAEFVQSEDGSSDESMGGSSRGGYSVADRIVIPRSGKRRVVSRTVAASSQQQDGAVVTELDVSSGKKVITSATTSIQSEETILPRTGTEPQAGETNLESTQEIVAPVVIADYFAEAPATPSDDDESKTPIPPSEVVPNAIDNVEGSLEVVADEVDTPNAGGLTTSATMAAVTVPAPTSVEVHSSSNVVGGKKPVSDVGAISSEAVSRVAVNEATNESKSTADTAQKSGFWGFFGKSEPKKPHTSEAAPSETETNDPDKAVGISEDVAPASTTLLVDSPASPSAATRNSLVVNEEQKERPTPQADDVTSPTAAASYAITTSVEVNEGEARTPADDFACSDVVDIPEPQHVTETIEPPEVSSKPQRDHGVLQAAAVVGMGAAVIGAVASKESGAHSFDNRPATSSGDEEKEAAPTIVTTTQTTTVTTEESESPSTIPHRKTGRSIWKFWGGDKPKSPLSEDEKSTEENHRAIASIVAPIAATSAEYESTATDDKIRSPVSRSQGAVTESPRDKTTALVGSGVVTTDVTQTTVEVVEEFNSGYVHYDTALSPASPVVDMTAVAETEQTVEQEAPKDVKSARAGGFWGFLGKKEQREESTTTTTTTVGWAVEREERSSHSVNRSENAAGATALVQGESIRRSIPSDGAPANVAVHSDGKMVRESDRRTTELMDGVEPEIELDEHQYVEVASPRHSGRTLNDGGLWTVKSFSLAWSKLRLNRKNWKNAPAGAVSDGGHEALLDDVSGALKAGEFLVITGPSKDESLALLSCLAGFEDAMEGNVTVNGREWNEKMNRYIAYVMREDLFYETLTVHEHLLIQAKLRMRRTHTDEMCLERVERVIEDMGLSGCRDKLIGGGSSLRGITKGERKLLALATALLTNPSILLVEEPTDELDTFSAEKIIAKLRWLAFEKGLTVAVTLHHPSSHFYGLFDVLYLVADASCVYDGKAADCVAYFATLGYQCPDYMSPMDYFMLQMVVGDRESDDEGVARVESLKRAWAERNTAVYAENVARAAAASEDAVVDEYDQKNRYYHMGCCNQLWLLWARHVRRLSRYGFVFWWHLLVALLIGVVFGLVYLQLDLDNQHGIQNFAGAFFYVVVMQMLFIAYRSFVFMPRETAIALRERQEYRGGWYHLLCWYFTKIVAELPALIVLSIALFVPVFLLVGIGHGFKVYIYMQIVMVLAGWAAIGLAFLTLGVLRHVTLALIVYAVSLVLFVAFGGLLINVTDIPDWLMWLHYISPVKYCYEAMMKIFWKRVHSIDCDWTLEGCVAFTGEGVLKYYSMEKRSALGDSLILLAICFALFFAAFWFLLALANKRISGLQWRYDWAFKGPLGRQQQRVGNAAAGEKHIVTRSSVNRAIERKSRHSMPAAAEGNSAVGENCYIRVETPRVGERGFCDAPSMTLGWSSLWLKTPKTKVNGESQRQEYLLSDASGSAKCGELVLVTGPSDESNVALLESLGGLQKRLKGNVTLNGAVCKAQKVSACTAYVNRDDLFYETLTVEEHLRFQAQLVLGKPNDGCGLCCGANNGDLEIERMEMALDELELTSKRHVLIRYLSSADTKLLAVATALLTNPSILFAEEPTCGMDFYSSQRVVLKLRQLARGGRTVVVTMAHPSSHLYALFDSLYLLAGGAAVYHGKVREAVLYFASLGYQCPQYMSPIDYFIRQVSSRGKDDEMVDYQATLFKEAWSTRCSEQCIADNNIYQEGTQGGEYSIRHHVGCCGQLSLLFRRHMLRLARYRVIFGWHAFWMVILGVIFGLIFLQLDLDNQQDIQNWVGTFFFIIVLQMLVIAYRTFVFLPREMAIAEREHHTGDYYMACWYLTKVITELPAILVLSVLLFVPAYLLIGIGHGFKLYFYMQLVMWLAGWSAAGMASLLLGLFRRVPVALIVYMLLLALFVVFGGLLVNVDDVPDYLIWLHYISPVKYGYEALMKLFWGRIGFLACGGGGGGGGGGGSGSGGSGSATFATVGDDYSFSMSGSGSFEDDAGCIAHSGDEVLSHYSMKKSRDGRADTVILLELAVLYFFIGYAFLSLRWRRHKTHQQRH